MRKTPLLLTVLTVAMAMPVCVATKIKSIKLNVEASEEDYEGVPELDIVSTSKKYYVDGYEVINDIEEETEDDSDSATGPGMKLSSKQQKTEQKQKRIVEKDKPFTCEITLGAEEEYTFDTMSKADISINGFGANCIKASRKDSGQTLVLTVEFPEIKSLVGVVEMAGWNELNRAEWTGANNATMYILRLYKDGKAKSTNYVTAGTSFDFSPAMLKEGTYQYTVKATNATDTKGKKTESETLTVTAEQAAINREKYGLKYDTYDIDGPGDDRNAINTGWQKEGEKYWYRMNDGMYTQMNWMEIDNEWYFFDENGYMLANEWISWNGEQYYLGKTGAMLRNSKTPDGYKVNSDGFRIN